MKNISISQKEKIEALKQNSYFAGLEAEALSILSQGTSLQQFDAGEYICWAGEPCTGLYMLRQGRVKLFKLSNKGRELIIRVMETGATFNEVPVFDDGRNVVNVASLEDSRVWVFEKKVIRQTLAEHPEMCTAIILNLTQNLRDMVGMIEELSFFQVTNRLARLISQLPDEQLSGSKDQRLTQDTLAARLGTVREVVARSLRELDQSGAIVVKRGRITVVNRTILEDWARCPDS
jgi:CRP-like cAMP-binding protein